MTVKDLKYLLKHLPDDLPVLKTEGDFYPMIQAIHITKMYALTDKERKSCYSFWLRKHMPIKRWFGKDEKYNKNDPQIFDCLLID